MSVAQIDPGAPPAGQAVLPLLIMGQSVLPGKSVGIDGRWDGERAIVPRLAESDGHLVLLPQAVHHSRVRPMIGVLAIADNVDSVGDPPKAHLFALRRVEILEMTRERGWTARIAEVDEEQEDDEAARRLDRVVRHVVKSSRLDGFVVPLISPPAGMGPSDLTDWVAGQIDTRSVVSLELLRATRWVDRVPILERLTKPARSRSPGRPKLAKSAPKRVDEDEDLPPEIREIVDQYEAEPGREREAPGLVAAQILREMKWEAVPQPRIDLNQARVLLDESHLGLESAKRSILDHMTLLEWQRRQGVAPSAGHAMCLVGPPGVGKTTLAAVVAEVTGRRLERLAIGGIDGIALGGADRTYKNSRPGEIVRRLRAASVHPSQVLWLLDEVDKVASGIEHSGVPILLSLLDPTQNSTWQDRFLSEVRIDLSGSIFIATANDQAAIPAALRDRLQAVRVPAYSQEEQIRIGREKLAPRMLSELGASEAVQLEDEAIASLVLDHPRSSGCRQLEQRLRVVLARALGPHMADGRPVRVTAEMARDWVPASGQGEAIGFRGSVGILAESLATTVEVPTNAETHHDADVQDFGPPCS